MGTDIGQYIQQWEVIVDKYVEHRKQTMALNPSWPEDDFRLALYGLPGNVLVTGLLGAKMIRTCLLSTAWWDANIEGNRTLSQRQHQTDQYVVHTKVGVYVLFFSMLEAVLRQLLRELKPGACNNAYDAFVNVYRSLLKHVGLQHHSSFLDFARELRNVIHNNGVHISKDSLDMTLTFDGKPYTFQHGKKVNFAYAELLFRIYEHALSFIDDLVACQPVSQMPATRSV